MAGAPWAGAVGFLVSTLTYVYLLAFVRRVNRAFPSTNPVDSTWWFGYLRDITNVFGMAAFSWTFFILGLKGWIAVLAGVPFTLAVYGLDYVLARAVGVRRPAIALLVGSFLLAVPMVLLREPIDRSLNTLVSALFST